MLYKAIDVWKRESNRAIRYRCFELVPDGTFCVQSADFYPLTPEKTKGDFLERQFVELFIEQAPEERSKAFQTLEDAIAWHDREFQNDRLK
jgi:hypothetical protein